MRVVLLLSGVSAGESTTLLSMLTELSNDDDTDTSASYKLIFQFYHSEYDTTDYETVEDLYFYYKTSSSASWTAISSSAISCNNSELTPTEKSVSVSSLPSTVYIGYSTESASDVDSDITQIGYDTIDDESETASILYVQVAMKSTLSLPTGVVTLSYDSL